MTPRSVQLPAALPVGRWRPLSRLSGSRAKRLGRHISAVAYRGGGSTAGGGGLGCSLKGVNMKAGGKGAGVAHGKRIEAPAPVPYRETNNHTEDWLQAARLSSHRTPPCSTSLVPCLGQRLALPCSGSNGCGLCNGLRLAGSRRLHEAESSCVESPATPDAR